MSAIELKPGELVRMIPGENAQQLADLTGVQRDLRLVAECFRVVQVRKGPGNEHIRRACFDSGVMRYRRCFKNAVRSLLSKSVLDQLEPAEVTLHERILELADRSVAHCVDGSEENIPYVVVGPQSKETSSLRISVFTGTVSHHNLLDAAAVEALAENMRTIARAQCDALAAVVLGQLQDMKLSGVLKLKDFRRGITDEGEVLAEKYRGKIKKKD